jgi:hypothetical protein
MRQLCSHEYPVRLPFPRTGDIVSVWHSLEGEEYEETPKSSSNSVLAQNRTVLVSRRVARLHQSAINHVKSKEFYEYGASTSQNILEQFEQIQIFLCQPIQYPKYVKKCFPFNSMSEGFYCSFQVSVIPIMHLLNPSYGGVIELLVSACRPISVNARKQKYVSARKSRFVILR